MVVLDSGWFHCMLHPSLPNSLQQNIVFSYPYLQESRVYSQKLLEPAKHWRKRQVYPYNGVNDHLID
jgi:hypothetical protein